MLIVNPVIRAERDHMTSRNVPLSSISRTAVRFARNARRNGRSASRRGSSFVLVTIQPLTARDKNRWQGPPDFR